MKRNVLLFLFLCASFISIFQFSLSVYGEEVNTEVSFIFDQIQVAKNNEVQVKINLNHFSDLFGVLLNIKFDETILEPIEKNGKYIRFASNSIFGQPNSEDYMFYKLIDRNILHLHLQKGKAINIGYNDGNNLRNLAIITFVAKQQIDDISDYFKPETYETGSTGVLVSLYTPFYQIIPHVYKYTDSIKIQWPVSSYEVDVFSSFPNFQEDILIENRTEEEYRLEIDMASLNIEKIGNQLVKINVFDLVNGEIYYESKLVQVVDRVAPILTVEGEVTLKDTQLTGESLNLAKVTDNYDKNIAIIPTYYDGEGKKISTQSQFLDYLKTHLEGKIVFHAADQSGNQAIPVETKIRIQDTTAPVITQLNDFSIKDTELNDFYIENLISVSDAYDPNPNYVLYALDLKGAQHEDYRELLEANKEVVVCYFGIDKWNNKTSIVQVKITLQDTTPPIITGVTDLEITDQELTNYVFAKDLVVTDNFDKSITYSQAFFLDEGCTSPISYQNFMNALAKGKVGYIAYGAVDSGGNESEIVVQKISVIDITKPVVIVHEVEEGKKYFRVSSISYEVTDNFEGEVSIEVYLNNEDYEGTPIENLGRYELLIVATDASGNVTHRKINFEIVKQSILGCGGDIDCYFDNYLPVVIIVCSILFFAIMITSIQIIHRKKQNRKANVTL